jgi:outer membrane immunogenic protein
MKSTSKAGALVAGAILSAVVAGNAMAADMAVKAPMLMKAPPPVYSWTGCFIAGGAGYGMFNQDQFEETDPGHVPVGASATTGGRGWFGTAGVGCDYQVNSSIVIGVFGDWDFGDIKGQLNIAPASVVFGTESEKWAWGAGGRIGWLVTPTVLTYVSAGYTQAHFNSVGLSNSLTGAALAFNMSANTYNGWFLGSGFEYAVSFLPSGFFFKSEYRYSTYQTADVPLVFNTSGLNIGADVNSKKFVQTVRSELVFRFNMAH